MIATKADAKMNYEKACHLGKKEGGSPAVERHITAPAEVQLGLVSIPIDRIAGTKSKGRSQSFSKGFYPILKENTEFASKWISLCSAHLNEGIREPIKAYEFMNRFYVEEGNKRVSVLKYFGAVSVPAYVIRIIHHKMTTRRPGSITNSLTFTVCRRSTISGFPGRKLCQTAASGRQTAK